jgi:hypothetical protein
LPSLRSYSVTQHIKNRFINVPLHNFVDLETSNSKPWNLVCNFFPFRLQTRKSIRSRLAPNSLIPVLICRIVPRSRQPFAPDKSSIVACRTGSGARCRAGSGAQFVPANRLVITKRNSADRSHQTTTLSPVRLRLGSASGPRSGRSRGVCAGATVSPSTPSVGVGSSWRAVLTLR